MLKVLTLLATMAASATAYENFVLAEGNLATHGAAFSVESGVAARIYCCNEFSIGPEVCGGMAYLGTEGMSSAWMSYFSVGVRTETKLDERLSLVVRGTIIPLGNSSGVYPGLHIGLKVGF